mgnify:CR=1 FL=1
MEVKNCKTCGKQFLSESDNSYCRICNKKWYEKQEKIREQAENLKWQEQKEYICMEQDIHIEDLQESVMQYGRMQSKIAETMKEIRYLTDIREAYQSYEEKQQAAESCDYQVERLELLQLQRKSKELRERIIDRTEGIKQQRERRGCRVLQRIQQLICQRELYQLFQDLF